jgi:arylsulfatase A-like enzyme/Tfp pilus assembly protein PilF
MQVHRLLLCASLLASLVSAADRAARPNIVLITLDTTRADRMGFLGSQRGLTPNLDKLARQSVVFTRAYAQEPLTTPSHAAILTGTYPQFNHVSDLGARLRKEIPYLPELLHRQGYHTAAFVGASILDPAMGAPGFARGFDIYDASFHKRQPGEDRYKSVERRAGEVVEHALGWLSKHTQGPVFLWIHVYDAHDPYDPPEPYKTRYASQPYDGEIAYTDAAMGKLFDGLRARGIYNRAVIAVMADHGEAFGEHGEERHGMFLYDETIHVPLLVKFPEERSAGKRIDGRVRLVDVAPTLLREAGVPVPAMIQGAVLQNTVKNEPVGSRSRDNRSTDDRGQTDSGRTAYAETSYPTRAFGWSGLHSWRAGKYLYVQAPKTELYDQSTDPGALHNLGANDNAVAVTMASQIAEFRRKTSSGESAKSEIDPAQAEQLRSLGYLASDSSAKNADDTAASVDPKDKIEIANQLHQALVDVELEQFQAAIPKLEGVVKEEPNAHAAYLELGRAWIHEQEYKKAVPMLQKAVELTPDSGIAHYELGLALVKTGAWEAAAPEFEAAVAKFPRSAESHFDLGAVYARLKRVPEATKEFETTLQLDPNHYQANLIFGHMLLLERDPAGALPKLQKAARLQPKSGEAHRYLAEAYNLLGQAQNAQRERALAQQARAPTSQ